MRFVGEQYDDPTKDKHIIINILCNDWVRIESNGKALEAIPLGYAFRLVFTVHALEKLYKKAVAEYLINPLGYYKVPSITKRKIKDDAKDKERRVKA